MLTFLQTHPFPYVAFVFFNLKSRVCEEGKLDCADVTRIDVVIAALI